LVTGPPEGAGRMGGGDDGGPPGSSGMGETVGGQIGVAQPKNENDSFHRPARPRPPRLRGPGGRPAGKIGFLRFKGGVAGESAKNLIVSGAFERFFGQGVGAGFRLVGEAPGRSDQSPAIGRAGTASRCCPMFGLSQTGDFPGAARVFCRGGGRCRQRQGGNFRAWGDLEKAG